MARRGAAKGGGWCQAQLITLWLLFSLTGLVIWLYVHLDHRRQLGAAPTGTPTEASPTGDEVSTGQLRALADVRVPAASRYDLSRVIAGSAGVPEANVSSLLQGLPGRRMFLAESPINDMLKVSVESAKEAADEDVGDPSCTDVHPNADSPDMLHVAFASDTSQVEGVMGSVSSIITSTASPDALTVHILVQKKWAKEFKERFGLRPECQGTVTVTGVLIKVHEIDGNLIGRSVAKVSTKLVQVRGAIDSMENFARFYMHLVLEKTVVIYLDADTIVQADLKELRKQLIASGKTIGFVARDQPVKMEQFLKNSKRCPLKGQNIKKLMGMTAYNVGVFAVNLKRWSDEKISERVEGLVAQHNACGGQLWIGGSQPPLLLAFLGRSVKDYTVFDAAWNTGDLGWRKNIAEKKLRTKYVLHWNGGSKPWMPDGLYRELWIKHRERFSSLLRPYDPGPQAQPVKAGVSKGKTKKEKQITTTMSPEEKSAQASCPNVVLLDEWTEEKDKCKIGSTFGCGKSASDMWTSGDCVGVFNSSKAVTVCGGGHGASCKSGSLPIPKSSCGLMIMTSYFTTKKDWQRNKLAKASFSKIAILYKSALQHGLNVTVVYDDLPAELLRTYACPRFRFVKVSLGDFSPRYGVNDVRYFFFERLVRDNKDWQSVFIVDAFDVRIGMNPCPALRDEQSRGKLYVGVELDKLKKHPWMSARFQKMGGKYLEWYQKGVRDKTKILNCGITGGRRSMMMKLLAKMTATLQDPAIAIMQKKEDINLNMAALNYIIYNSFSNVFLGNPPVHSLYKRFQTMRTDVWFIHK